MRKLLLSIIMTSTLIGELWAQNRTVSGKVTSGNDGSTLPGVSVVLKGTTTGTTSGLNGNWKLGLASDVLTLEYYQEQCLFMESRFFNCSGNVRKWLKNSIKILIGL